MFHDWMFNVLTNACFSKFDNKIYCVLANGFGFTANFISTKKQLFPSYQISKNPPTCNALQVPNDGKCLKHILKQNNFFDERPTSRSGDWDTMVQV